MEGGIAMALYTYDEQVDVLYVLLAPEPEASIKKTVELGERLHVDLAPDGSVVGVEILYPKTGRVDLGPLKERYHLAIEIPFNFAA
jgi:uncharacterized protein YuzE